MNIFISVYKLIFNSFYVFGYLFHNFVKFHKSVDKSSILNRVAVWGNI